VFTRECWGRQALPHGEIHARTGTACGTQSQNQTETTHQGRRVLTACATSACTISGQFHVGRTILSVLCKSALRRRTGLSVLRSDCRDVSSLNRARLFGRVRRGRRSRAATLRAWRVPPRSAGSAAQFGGAYECGVCGTVSGSVGCGDFSVAECGDCWKAGDLDFCPVDGIVVQEELGQ